MYATCLYCNAALGRNEMVEHFPVGRRLAFDAARGRLWVVCPRCTRWNLTPIEQRWEAIEECERLFRDTRLRVSTGNIGLARAADGLELVRIGQPQRPEFAAWRYGREFRRRRRRALAVTGASLVVVGGVQVALHGLTPALLLSLPAIANGHALLDALRLWRQRLRPVMQVRRADGGTEVVRGMHVQSSMLLTGDDAATWRLRVDHRHGFTVLDGAAAHRTLGRLLAHANLGGGSGRAVSSAVQQLSTARSADDFILRYVKRVNREARYFAGDTRHADANSLGGQSTDERLALEMALHEETERAALEGELVALEAAWKEAEEIAAIADDLLLPDAIMQRLSGLKGSRLR